MQVHNKRVNTTQGWRVVAGHRLYFRSAWEYRYALYLQYLKKDEKIETWEHEPQTFYFEGIKRGVTNYKPDYRINNFDGTHEWVDVKGYWDAKSLTKVKRFRKYFPQEKLTLVDAKWFKNNNVFIKFLEKKEPPISLP